MKKSFIILISIALMCISACCLSETKSVTLSKEFLASFSQKDLTDLHSFVIGSIQNDDYSLSIGESSGATDMYCSIYDACIENVLYSSIFVSSNLTTNNDYVSSMSLETNLPFGDQIHDSQIYIDTINEYVLCFGTPQYTSIDERNKMMKGNNSVSWYIDEYNITITVLYHDGNISNSIFPVLETLLFQGDLRIK